MTCLRVLRFRCFGGAHAASRSDVLQWCAAVPSKRLSRTKSMRETLGVLLAGGAGERLYPLTRDRAKPAVTFGGIYRIIDITLSNCVNSDLRKVYILTQYKALSLNRHIREGWSNVYGREIGEFIEISAAHEAGQRKLVHGYRRCGLPEHLFHRLGTAQVRAHPVGRSHLQDEL